MPELEDNMMQPEEPKSKKAILIERYKGKYPDKEYGDDESLYGQALDDYAEYDRQMGEKDAAIENYKKNEGELVGMFSSDPRAAAFLLDMKNGEDPALGLVRRFGPEIKGYLEDDANLEELAKAQADYLERITKERDLEEMYNKNIDESKDVLEAYQKECGLTDQQCDDLINAIVAVGNDMVVGKFSRDTLDMFAKAMNYDKAVAEAANEGEVRGRNAKIVEGMRKRGEGDGVANIGGKNGTAGSPENMPQYGALDRFDNGVKDIWARGNMKRTRRQ